MEQMQKAIEVVNNALIMAHLPRVGILDILEIIMLTTIFYYIAKSLRGTRAWVLLKGVIIMFSFYALAYLLHFNAIVIIFQNIILFIGMAIVVIIQPDLRKMLERIGTKNLNVSFKNLIHTVFKDKAKGIQIYKRISDQSMQEIVKGCSIMGKAKTGVLIVIEGNIPLNEYIESGIEINADITSQLLINIFEHNTPLHDGAVIIQNNKISAATCYLPLSDSKDINKDLGTRHRAGIGISECTDAFVIIVSEETGAISVVNGGKLRHNLDREGLIEALKEIQNEKVYKETQKKKLGILHRNFPLKITCLVGTAFMWLMIITTANPIVSTTIRGVEVEELGTEIITNTGKTYEVIEGGVVNVTLKDRKDVIDSITKEDIKVTADFSKLSYVNSIPLDAKVSNQSDTEIRLSESTMVVSLEDIITTEVNIDINKIGEPNDKYYISNIKLSNETLIISGAKSVINTIGRVTVDIDESKLTSNMTMKLTPVIYDKNGKQLNNSRFKLNHETIDVSIELYKTKFVELRVKHIIENSILSNIITNVECEEKQVYITGTDEALEKFDILEIEIPLDISLGEIANNQFIKVVALQNYLPEGIYVTPKYSKINLLIDFKDFYTKAISFDSTQLSIVGLEDNLKIDVEAASFNIDIVSISSDILDKTLEEISPYIDVSGMEAGTTEEVTIQFNELNNAVFKTLVAKVTIENKG